MKHFLAFAICAGTIIATANTALAAPSIKSGQWRITTETTMQGMPNNTSRMKNTFNQCLNGKDLEDPASIKQMVADNTQGNCDIASIDETGSGYTWEMRCNQGGMLMIHKGRMTITNETAYEGQIEYSMDLGEMGDIPGMDQMKLGGKASVSGAYIGPCPEATP